MMLPLLLLFLTTTHAFVPLAFTTRSTSLLYAQNKLDDRLVEGEIEPLNNFLLVQIDEAAKETDGGILLTNKQTKTQGTVVSMGPGKTHVDTGINMQMPVAPGDGVVYGQYDGIEVDWKGSKHTLIRDDDVLVKYTNNELTLDTVQVCNDYVLVQVDVNDNETEGGILIAASSDTAKPSTGTVVRVGPGRIVADGSRTPMDVQVGDGVKFRDFAGNQVDIDNAEYSVVKMAEIMAKY